MQADPKSYRPDIDGLRAIAITFVLAYHLIPTVMPGGFFGVDIFFVISGYLMWKISRRRLDDKIFSIFKFYINRLVRLAPALIFMLLVTFLLGHLFLLSDDFSNLGKQIFNGSIFTSNIYYWSKTGYFDPKSNEQALLHLWSLGLEGQFYLIFPITMALLLKCKRPLVAALGLTALALGTYIFTAKLSSTTAFFLIIGRFWQFLFGIVAALIEENFQNTKLEPLNKYYASIGRWNYISFLAHACVVSLAICAFFVHTDSTHFIYYSSIPTLLTAALIVLNNRLGAVAVIKIKPMLFLGKISYPLYLWHWPIIFFIKTSNSEYSSAEISFFTLAIALPLSFFTYLFIETPIQSWARKRISLAGAFLLLSLALSALAGRMTELGYLGSKSSTIESTLNAALRDWETPIGGLNGSELIVNSVLSKNRNTTLFIGDSHIEQYWPRIKKLILENPNSSVSASFLSWGGCPPFPDTREIGSSRPCDVFVRKVFEMAQHPEIQTVVIAAYWEWYFVGQYDKPETMKPKLMSTRFSSNVAISFEGPEAEAAFLRLENEIQKLIHDGKNVVLVLSNPVGKLNDPRQMLRDLKKNGGINIDKYGSDQAKFVEFAAPVIQKLRTIAKRTGAAVIDPVDFLCNGVKCLAMHDNKPIHRDDDHLRPFFVRDHVFFLDATVSIANRRGGKE